jgi:hypothetical protein
MVFFTLFQKKNKKILQGGCTQKRTKNIRTPPQAKLMHTGHSGHLIYRNISILHIHNVHIVNVQRDKFNISLQAS